MLIQLTVRNFAIIDELVVDFSSGMSVITGETGAGKSIAIDALGLCLGERAEASMVRQGKNRADICAQFSLIDAPLALSWLQDNHFEEQQECFLRRVITADGRSKAFINGTAVPLTQLRYLGELLIQVHGQHAHQRLLKPEVQRHLLDAYGHYPELLTEMKNDFQLWQQAKQTLQSHQQMRDALKSRQDLLSYQLKELREFAPQAGEFEQIDEEYKRLSNSEQLLSLSEQAVYLLSDRDKDNALSILNQVKKLLDKLVGVDNRLAESYSLIESASIQVAELADELRVYSQSIELNPEHVKFLEERLSKQISLARKHHVSPETLADHWQLLEAEYKQLDDYDDKTHKLTEIVAEKYQQALKAAKKLHQRREHYAKELSNKITSSMSELAMPHGLCEITLSFHDDKLSEEGADKVELLVTTNPGQPLAALSKVVSGGELSRISLSVQVITAQKMALPALIFDEVDVGISGGTATTVGHLLRQLSAVTQVICVTHLPQVAGCGHHHYFVDKATDGKQTVTSMQELDKQQRINELARLLGGSSITKNTLANAKELLVSN